MRNYIFMLGAAFLFLLLASCGGANSEKDTSEADVKQEEQIANEVVESSENAKSDAETNRKRSG